MKTLRSILYVIVAIFLGIFINLLSMSLVLKNVIQKETMSSVVKSAIANQYFNNNKASNLTEEQEKLIKDFLNDNDGDAVLDIFINNYMNYLTDENYKVSEKDVDTVKNYVSKHKDVIKKISKEDIDVDNVLKEINAETIHNETKKALENVEKDMSPEVKSIITTYQSFTIGPIKMALAGLVAIFILLLMLISWSLVKWMKATGVCLITNGILITLLYITIVGVKDLIFKYANVEAFIQNITFNNILIIGLVELALGISLVIIHKKVNKSTNNEDSNTSNVSLEENAN